MALDTAETPKHKIVYHGPNCSIDKTADIFRLMAESFEVALKKVRP